MKHTLYFQCTVKIASHPTGVKIYKNEDDGFITWSFELSHYYRDAADGTVYHPGSGSVDTTLEGLVFKLNLYAERFHQIVEVEQNSNF